MIKAIIFDAGGVIIEGGDRLDMIERFFPSSDKNDLRKKISDFLEPLWSGRISEKEYWRMIAESEKINPDSVPDNLWVDGYEETTCIKQNVAFLLSALRKNYKLILVSNTVESHARINKRRGLFDYFDDVVNSYDVNLTKNSAEIFELTLKRNNLCPNECIFIDDMQKFVDVACSIGIDGILYKNANQLKKELLSRDLKLD